MRCLLDPVRTILVVKIQKIIFGKNCLFWVFYDPNDPILTHMNGKRKPISKSAHQLTPGAQKPKNDI